MKLGLFLLSCLELGSLIRVVFCPRLPYESDWILILCSFNLRLLMEISWGLYKHNVCRFLFLSFGVE